MASPFQRRFAATALLAALALPVLAQQPPATPPAASAKAPEGRHERRHGDHATAELRPARRRAIRTLPIYSVPLIDFAGSRALPLASAAKRYDM